MSSTVNVTVEDIPFTPIPAPQVIEPGRRVRLVNLTSASLNGLTGTTQAIPSNRVSKRATVPRLDVLLDESSTDFLRRDFRVGNNRKITAPAPDLTRKLVTGVPTDSMFYAENDSDS